MRPLEDRQERAQRRVVALSVATGLVVAVMLVTLSLLGAAFSEAHDVAVHELSEATLFHRSLDRVLQLVVDAETAHRGYVLTGDSHFLAPLEETHRELPETLDQVIELLSDRRGEALGHRLEEEVAAQIAFSDEVVALMDEGHEETALDHIASGEGRLRMERVRDAIERAHGREDHGVEDILAEVERTRTRTRVAFGSLMLVTMLMALGLGFSMRANLQRTRTALRIGREEARRFRMLAEGARDLVRIHQLDGRIEYASPSSTALLGYTPDELLALPRESLLADGDKDRLKGIVEEALSSRTPPEPFRHTLRRKDGQVRLFETRLELAEDPDGTLTRFHTVSRDVTEDAVEQDRLSTLATIDELTGLLNRRAFIHEGQALLDRCSEKGLPAALFFCDVNGLKEVNDNLGHAAGDALLEDVARMLSASIRGTDLLARLGGDEFVALGPVDDTRGAEAFQERLVARLREHNASSDRPYRLSVSVGAALRRPEDTTPLETLLSEADAAMYRDKQGHRTRHTDSGQWIVRTTGRPVGTEPEGVPEREPVASGPDGGPKDGPKDEPEDD
jgi:diguanylate cyclase (GGDEF)-like protein/PAS domain S-box-containing protein